MEGREAGRGKKGKEGGAGKGRGKRMKEGGVRIGAGGGRQGERILKTQHDRNQHWMLEKRRLLPDILVWSSVKLPTKYNINYIMNNIQIGRGKEWNIGSFKQKYKSRQ